MCCECRQKNRQDICKRVGLFSWLVCDVAVIVAMVFLGMFLFGGLNPYRLERKQLLCDEYTNGTLSSRQECSNDL